MHADEVLTDAALVRRLIREQFPGWAGLPVRYVRSSGTDNDVYRVGDDLTARLPRIGGATAQVATEARWLPRFAPHLPLAVPTPLAVGRPGEGYPYPWAVNGWLPGSDAGAGVDDPERAARDLAGFVRALRLIDTHDGPGPSGRGGPLAERDADVRRSIALLGDRIDGDAALRSWAEALEAPVWEGDGRWTHGDLLPGNLLLTDGRLSGVIDFGGLAVGDPACDLQPAWNLFAGRSRRVFLDELDVDEASRLRGRGWVLSQAVMALPYYWETNPGIVRQALHGLGQALAD
jgi:aminoglycoside phosphotransferase (APT) family kinase protein